MSQAGLIWQEQTANAGMPVREWRSTAPNSAVKPTSARRLICLLPRPRRGPKRLTLGRWAARNAVLMARSRTAGLVVLGSVFFAIVGTMPHVLFAFRGVRPFWSRFESIALAWIVPHLPEAALHSVPRAVSLLVILWLLVGGAITALFLAIPAIRNWAIRRQLRARGALSSGGSAGSRFRCAIRSGLLTAAQLVARADFGAPIY
jgi:hypothetical protein